LRLAHGPVERLDAVKALQMHYTIFIKDGAAHVAARGAAHGAAHVAAHDAARTAAHDVNE
jgi:hypothetical protein